MTLFRSPNGISTSTAAARRNAKISGNSRQHQPGKIFNKPLIWRESFCQVKWHATRERREVVRLNATEVDLLVSRSWPSTSISDDGRYLHYCRPPPADTRMSGLAEKQYQLHTAFPSLLSLSISSPLPRRHRLLVCPQPPSLFPGLCLKLI